MNSKSIHIRISVAALAASLAILGLAACSNESANTTSSGEPDGDAPVTISFLAAADEATAKAATDLVAAFNEKYPNITVNIDNYPSGTEGNNVIKTKLATGEMNDVFFWNSGALMQTLDPDKTLVDLSGESWMSQVDPVFQSVVKTDTGVYGAPFGSSQAGGFLYNKKVYADLGLSVPKSWAEFMDNSAKVKAAGLDPVIQTYGTQWTSQLIVLGNFANVLAEDPEWATKYTANKAHFVDAPMIAGFDHMADVLKAGYNNEDFASATIDQGLEMLADGKGAVYPNLSSTIATIVQNQPDKVADIGFFAPPADDPQYTAATIWQPWALYIPQTSTGAKLDAAKKFVEFASSSDEGCAVQNADLVPSGPYVTTACTLPSDVPPLLNDIQAYFDAKKVAPALEFIVPVTAPDMQSVTIAVGTGINTPAEGAALADQQVATQAQQLGLPGW